MANQGGKKKKSGRLPKSSSARAGVFINNKLQIGVTFQSALPCPRVNPSVTLRVKLTRLKVEKNLKKKHSLKYFFGMKLPLGLISVMNI